MWHGRSDRLSAVTPPRVSQSPREAHATWRPSLPCSLLTPLTAPRLRSCSCQLEDDEISGRAYDSETAENRISVLVQGEESAPRVFPSLIRLLQMLRWGCKLDGRCVHYQPSISPDRLHFQVVQSVFCFSSLPLTLSSSACHVWQSRARASSPLPWYMGRWHTCALTLTHDAKELSGSLLVRVPGFFYGVASTEDGNVMPLGFSGMQRYKRTHINELSRVQSHFLILCLAGSRKHTYTRIYLNALSLSLSLSLPPSLLLVPVQDQSPALSLWIQHYPALFIYFLRQSWSF